MQQQADDDVKYEITYFPAKGRAEFLRLIFAAAGKEFKDTRIAGEDWQAFKPETPMGAMPVLKVSGGGPDVMLCQSNAIANFLGKRFHLHGSTLLEEAFVSEFLESVSETMAGIIKWFGEKDEEKKKEHMKSFTDVIVPKFVNFFNLRRQKDGNGYINGSKITIADICCFSFIDQMKSVPGLTVFDNYPEINEHYDKVKSNDGIAKWRADHEETTK